VLGHILEWEIVFTGVPGGSVSVFIHRSHNSFLFYHSRFKQELKGTKLERDLCVYISNNLK
jgi:hypothetical protein